MATHRIAYSLLALSSLLALAQHGWYWNQLPDRVATHFNWRGEPDAWMSKHAATLAMCCFQLGMPLLMLVMAELVAVLPVRWINLPHREIWLSPERRGETIAYVRGFMARIAVLLTIFFLALNHLVFRANRDSTNLNSLWFAGVLLTFLLCIFQQTRSMQLRFRHPSMPN